MLTIWPTRPTYLLVRAARGRAARQGGNGRRPRAVRTVFTATKENVASFNFCFQCGAPPAAAVSKRPLLRPTVTIDRVKLQARRTQAETAMQGRPGQVRKDVVTAQFDLFLMSNSDGAQGWLRTGPDDVVDWFCFLDS